MTVSLVWQSKAIHYLFRFPHQSADWLGITIRFHLMILVLWAVFLFCYTVSSVMVCIASIWLMPLAMAAFRAALTF